MKLKEMGSDLKPTVMLLHGGGLSYWSFSEAAGYMKDEYHIVMPIIEGHGGNGEFVSIENSAENIIDYINKSLGGRVRAIVGVSLGAQITAEILAQKSNIAQYAVVESALACRAKVPKKIIESVYNATYWLIGKKWFSRLQAKAMLVPKSMFEQYYNDSLRISKQSLINMAYSNITYQFKGDIAKTRAKVLILTGEREKEIIRKSAHLLNETIEGSTYIEEQKMKHCGLLFSRPEEYASLIMRFIS